MRRLVTVRLVNWYHFAHEVFTIRNSTLLLGDNGSGKSTVLDAIQLALVADMGQVRFNKAANDQSRRSLYGYVRHKLGTEDESRPGHVRFGRGACTSYVILGFTDDDGSSFACGVVMDATESDTNVSRTHFVWPGLAAADVPALREDELVRPEREFRAVLREAKALPFPDARSYRAELRQRLGPLPESFHRLIVKGLDFKLIGRVEDFVHNYLLDEDPVDTAALQTNLENYKRLEGKAREAELRVEELEKVCGIGERIGVERQNADGHLYIVLASEAEMTALRVEELAGSIAENRGRASAITLELSAVDQQIASASRERDRIIALLQQTAVFQQRESLERDLSRAREDRDRSEHADAEARRILEAQSGALDTLSSEDARALRGRRPELFDRDEELVGRSDRPPIVDRLRDALRRDGALGGRDLNTWRSRLEKAKDAVSLAKLRLNLAASALKAEGEDLSRERAQLEKGRHLYPDGAEALLHLLRAKLRGKREPVPLCEVIDVKSDRWRDAVEGYLNTRRFDILVAPEDFGRALSLYERHKRAYALPGRGEVFIHGVGLVDADRLAASRPRREPRSLAEQIETDDPLARVYADYVLGDVVCCDSETELRQHKRAITDTVMVYQNHVARQTAPQLYARHYIGQAARVRRLDEIDRRHGVIVTELRSLDADMAWLDRAASVCSRALVTVARLPDLVDEGAQLLYRRDHVTRLERQLASLDTREIDALAEQREGVEALLRELGGKRDALISESGSNDRTHAHLLDLASAAHVARDEARQRFETELAHITSDTRAAWDARYRDEREARDAQTIRDAFLRQHKIRTTVVTNLVNELAVAKAAYAQKYAFFTETLSGEDFSDFANERDAWRESRLPEYRTQIARAKEEAIQQLAEDIIFRLRERLRMVERQIRGLNDALKDVRFGSDRYRFTTQVAASHRPFYELIQAAGAHEKDSLFGHAALHDDAARDTLRGLFDRLVEGQPPQSARSSSSSPTTGGFSSTTSRSTTPTGRIPSTTGSSVTSPAERPRRPSTSRSSPRCIGSIVSSMST